MEMNMEEIYGNAKEYWVDVIVMIIEENLENLLAMEGIEEKYEKFDDIPADIMKVLWVRQSKIIQDDFNGYVDCMFGEKAQEAV